MKRVDLVSLPSPRSSALAFISPFLLTPGAVMLASEIIPQGGGNIRITGVVKVDGEVGHLYNNSSPSQSLFQSAYIHLRFNVPTIEARNQVEQLGRLESQVLAIWISTRYVRVRGDWLERWD